MIALAPVTDGSTAFILFAVMMIAIFVTLVIAIGDKTFLDPAVPVDSALPSGTMRIAGWKERRPHG